MHQEAAATPSHAARAARRQAWMRAAPRLERRGSSLARAQASARVGRERLGWENAKKGRRFSSGWRTKEQERREEKRDSQRVRGSPLSAAEHGGVFLVVGERKETGYVPESSVAEITNSSFEPAAMMAKCDPRHGK